MPRKVIIWTKEEDERLLEMYPSTAREIIVNELNRTWKAIRLRAMKLGVQRSKDIVKEENVKYTKEAMLSKYGVEYSTQLPSMKEKSRQTNLRKRGVEYPSQASEVREKVIQTVREKYGVDNVFQSHEIKEKITQTLLDTYGVTNPLKNTEIKEKAVKTNIERYGVKNPFQLTDRVKEGMLKKHGNETPLMVPEISERARKTSQARYGTQYPNQSKVVRDKIENTNLEKYGFSSTFKNKAVKRKIVKTNLEKYGEANPAKNNHVKNKFQSTCMINHGVKSFLCLEDVRRKGRELSIKNNSIGKSKGEIAFKKYLCLIDPNTEHHKEHPILKHVMDFYMPQYDLWVQYDGDYWHGKDLRSNTSTRQYLKIQKTMERDSIQNSSVPNLIRFWSSEVVSAINCDTVFELIIKKIEEKIDNNSMCHQFLKKLEWYHTDIQEVPFNIEGIKASDFILQPEKMSEEIKEFIERYEWLGTIGFNVKWSFTARYQGVLSGVVLISEPSSYSTMLGEHTPTYEALIQRGATVSWAPRNLGSRLIMFSCKWLVKNTSKRLFVGYADPEANERGTIYRACNFDYIGNNFGDAYSYTHPSIHHTFSSRYLRRTSTFKVWCKKNNVELKQEWFKENQFKDLSKIPDDVKIKWYSWGRQILKESTKQRVAKKSKYAILIGKNKADLKNLKLLVNYKILPYPPNNGTTDTIKTTRP